MDDDGSAKQAKGAVKEAVGSLTGDPRLQAEGKADKLAGKAQSAVGRVKDPGREILGLRAKP